MKKNRVSYIVMIFLGLISTYILTPLILDTVNRYEDFYNYEKDFTGIVVKSTSGSMGSRIITFKNGQQFDVDQFFRSDTIKEEQLSLKKWEQDSFNMFLQYGDSIIKRQRSDTVYVIRKMIKYTFVRRFHENLKTQ